MLHIFTVAKYADILYVMASAMVLPLLLLKNIADGFLCAEFWIVECFPRCSIHHVNVVRFAVLMFHPNEHVNNM
jgi:hypothetical protein